ncbi:MAG: hypothetical protein C0415_05915 [Thermodesulfovibrio sp.]|nr:hypothetical protein [Thermodesulfovibrio sp.]
MDNKPYFYIPPLRELESIPKPARVKGDRWGYCGIAAISAAISIPPLDVYKAIPNWPGYTPSKMIIKTLNEFGFECLRTLIPKKDQRQFPRFTEAYPSSVALGRIYWGEGKFVDSHWICFKWRSNLPSTDMSIWAAPDLYPMLFDNGLASLPEFGERWISTTMLSFWGEPVKIKSLYFVMI